MHFNNSFISEEESNSTQIPNAYMKPSRFASDKNDLSLSTFFHSMLIIVSLKIIPWYFGIGHII